VVNFEIKKDWHNQFQMSSRLPTPCDTPDVSHAPRFTKEHSEKNVQVKTFYEDFVIGPNTGTNFVAIPAPADSNIKHAKHF
jgi:hypothetical protein